MPKRAFPAAEQSPGHGDASGSSRRTRAGPSDWRISTRFRGEQGEAAWGRQIRSYVIQPYQMVKDLRTEQEVGNVQGVLDGDLMPFVESYLRWRRANHEVKP